MADTKISALTALTGANAAGGDLLTVVDISDTSMAASGTNKSITLTELEEYLERLAGLPRIKRLGSAHVATTTACTKVTDLDLAVTAGTYYFDYRLLIQSATITVGAQFNFNFTGTTTTARWWFCYADLSATLLAAIGTMAHDTTTSTLGFQMAKAEDDMATTAVGNMGPIATTNAWQTINTDHMVQITGLLVASGSGNLELWHGSETATSTTVSVGSSLVVIQTG